MILYHAEQSGFILAFSDQAVLFDMISPRQALPNELLDGKKITIFTSHGHQDHWRSRIICEFPEAAYVVDRDIFVPRNLDVRSMSPYQQAGVNHLTIQTFGSTDQGLSFYLTLPDNRRILHCGDLNWWHWQSNDESTQLNEAHAFKAEIDRMKDKDVFLTMVPVDPRLSEAAHWAAQYIIDTLHPSYLVNMHTFNRYEESRLAMQSLRAENTKLLPLTNAHQIVFEMD